MSARNIALPMLLLVGVARVASADVSLTDQQVFVSAAAATRVTAGLAAGQVPRLIDATGLEWFVNDEVTYATTSSAVGAASDAAFVGAVEATTASGGSELSILADAFDGYNALRVTVGAGAPVLYNNVGSATSDCNGRQILEPAATIGGLQVSRKIYVPSTDGFARWLNIVSNPGGAAQTVTLQIVNDLGSDAGTTIGATSDGDTTAEITDDWVTTYKAFVQGSSPSPRLAHVLQSPGAPVRVSAITFADGSDTPSWSYNFSVPAGGSVVVANFAAGLASRADAALKAAQLASLPPGALACMSTTELAALSNVAGGAVPTGPEPTGPGGLTITSPTTATSFTAGSPFISIGGIAGPARLTGVTWTSNRGFSGVAQGSSEWTIPSAPLLAGANVFTVTAAYSTGASITDTLTVNLGALTYQLAEGATGSFFTTDLLIANPSDTEVLAGVRFLKSDGTTITIPDQELLPRSRLTIRLNTVPGIESTDAVSSVVTSPNGVPLVVERTMFWGPGSYGSHGAAAAEGPRTRFLFGEGSQGFFDTYLLLANSNPEPAEATVQFFPESGPTVTREYIVPANSRLSIWTGGIPPLANQSFSMTVDTDLPVVAERAMYFGQPLFNGGSDSPGATAGATTWFFGEGATGGFFNTFFLVGNPSSRNANVTMTFQLTAGGTVTVNKVVPAFGRLTVNPAAENAALANAAFALSLTSDELVIAERSMYWSLASGAWYEAHNAFGVNEPARKWGLAEGRVGTAQNFQTYILVGNTTSTPSTVRVTYLRVGGSTVVKSYEVAANSRFTIDVNSTAPELQNEDFGALLEVTEGSPVIVERSLYSTANGVPFAAGTSTQAVRLP
jgi:hypothetical protein